MPEWYPTIIVAKYYGVTPDDAMKMSLYWKERTKIAISAENQAQKILSNRK